MLSLTTVACILLSPQQVSAGSVRAAGNSFETEARNKCTTEGDNNVYGASWANNGGGQYSTTFTIPYNATTVGGSMYSSAYVCAGTGTRTNIRGVNISSNDGRLSFSGTQIFRDTSATSGQFTTIDLTQQPLGITLNLTGLNSGTHSFSYFISYSDNLGTTAAVERQIIITIDRAPAPTFDLDGVKIDNSGVSPTGNSTGFGGNCYSATNNASCGNGTLASYPFSDDNVNLRLTSATSGTSVSTEPFFFTDFVAGTYRVSVRNNNPDWDVVGYSICNSTSAANGCTSQRLTDSDSGIIDPPATEPADAQVKYFDYTFAANNRYSMRWIYAAKVARVNGVKIDDRGYAGGDRTSGYGGNCENVGVAGSCNGTTGPYPFSNDTVSVETAPAASSNNFFGILNIKPGLRKISVNDDNPDWGVIGANICETGGTCQNVQLTNNPVAYGGSSFTYDLKPGKTYDMRWIYKKAYDPPDPVFEPGCSSMPSPYQTFAIPDTRSYQGAPSGYAGSPNQVAYETYPNGRTDALAVYDISSGGETNPVPNITDDATYQQVTLNYKPYMDAYPYDQSKPSVNYNVYYTQRTWRSANTQSTGPEYHHDDNGNGTIEAGEMRGDPIGYKWEGPFDSQELSYNRTETSNPPQLEPCQQRNFSISPTTFSAQMNTDPEDPNNAVFTARVVGNFTAPSGTKNHLRKGMELNTSVTGDYYIEGANGSPRTGTSSFTFSPSPFNITSSGVSKTYDLSNGTHLVSHQVDARRGIVTQYGDRFCFRATITPSNGTMNRTGGIVGGSGTQQSPYTCTERVSNKPYFKVFGGDIFAGGSFKQGANCNPSPNRQLIGYYRPATGVGAGTDMAATALGPITDVTSASVFRTSYPQKPTGLTFANTGVGGFGGSFGSLHCVTDYFETTRFKDGVLNESANSRNVNDLATGKQSLVSNASGLPFMLNTTAPVDTRHTIYVSKDVYIRNNIIYAGGTRATPLDMPYFTLIVRGNIYIDKNVTQLDGLYIAQPNGASGGKILTCTDNNGSAISAEAKPTECFTNLRVNGAFIAQSIIFQRTKGTLKEGSATETFDTNGNIAEAFRGTAESYLGRPVLKADTFYDSIKALPPVL